MVKEICTVRNVVPKGMAVTSKSVAALEPNCGGKVGITPGDWLLLDTEVNNSRPRWVENGIAEPANSIPDGVDYLDENTTPQEQLKRQGFPPSIRPGRRGDFSLYSAPTGAIGK